MKNFSVVIVDDSREWCASLKSELETYSLFKVAPPVFNGKEAIEYLEGKHPEIIVLDLIMPIYDGFYIVNYIRDNMDGYNPYIYVLSAIGTNKTNRILRNADVNYYSVKPISPQAVAYNLHKLVVDNEKDCYLFTSQPPLISLDNQIEDFLYELGAPLYLMSTKCTKISIQLCLMEEYRLNSITNVYECVTEQLNFEATPSAVEQNIACTIQNMQKIKTNYFLECFAQSSKITNAEFLNRAIFLLKRRIEDYFGEQVFIKSEIGAH